MEAERLDGENWLPLVGYETNYLASSLGRMWSITYSRLMALPIHSGGYVYVCLWQNGKARSLSLHRLIAKTFIPTDDHTLQVNHINGIKTDNRVCNLEWCSKKENIIHSFKKLGRRSSHFGVLGADNHKSKPVICVTTGEKFVSVKEAAKYNGVTDVAMSRACKSPENRSKGKQFKYA